MANLETLTLKMCPSFSGLDEQNLENYVRAKRQAGFLGTLVIEPFESALKAATGYSEENIPKIKTVSDIAAGDLKFKVATNPTTKRPNYCEVFGKLVDYVSETRIDAKKKEIEGITLVDGVGYCIPVNDLLGKVNSWLEVDPTVKQQIERPIMYVPQRLVVPYKLDFSDISENVAKTYLETFGFAKQIVETVVEPFEIALKSETGYSKEKLPKRTEATWVPVGNTMLRVLSVPYPSPKYAEAVNGVVADLETIKAGSQIVGYKVQDIDGRRCVLMKAVVDRLNDVLEENTETKLRQEISYIPNVEITM